ncbi:MAG TPA: M28 family peptidase [Anaerolineales bacterium]|nr:M28 family peptidase [Anaerolineales bacterium]
MGNRRLIWLFAVLGLIVLAGGAAAYYLWVTPGTPIEPGVFDGDRSYADVIAQVEMGPRVPGAPGHAAFLQWATASLETAGWAVEIQETEYHGQPVRNVIARRSPLDPGAEWILLGAHYDTREFADRDPEPANRTLPVPGANDGASGVAVLLELARVLPDTGKNVWIVLFDAEDGGDIDGGEWIVGSQAFVEALPGMAGGRLPDAVVIVDMIGDADLNIHIEMNSDPNLVAEIWGTARELGHGDVFLPVPKYSMLDDHTPFLRAGIPAALLIDFDYPPWHTVEDTVDKVSAESLGAVGETLVGWLGE